MTLQNFMQAIQSLVVPLQSSIFPIQWIPPLRQLRCCDRTALSADLMDVRSDTGRDAR